MNSQEIIILFFRDTYFKFILDMLVLLLLIFYIGLEKWFKASYNVNINRILFKYSLNYFYIEIFLSFIYIIGYVSLILFIRLKYLSEDVNLYPIIHLIKAILYKLSIVDSALIMLFLLLLLLFCMLFLKQIHHYFTDHILKAFLFTFYRNYQYFNFLEYIEKYTLLCVVNKCLDIVLKFFSGFRQAVPQLSQILDRQIQQLYVWIINSIRFLFFTLPFLLLIIFFLYEMIFNNYTLSINFNRYLLFFVIYTMYKRVSTFIEHTDHFINRMLFDIYYRKRSVKYVNVPEIYQQAIYNYILSGLIHNSDDLFIFNANVQQMINMSHRFGTLDYIIYFNSNNETIDLVSECQDKDIVPYLYWDNFDEKRIKNANKYD